MNRLKSLSVLTMVALGGVGLLWGMLVNTAVQAAPLTACAVRVDSTDVDYGDLQTAIDNVDPAGDLLKIAGTCADVTVVSGTPQVGYIDQSLTIRGGYTTTNWMVSDPIANPTVIDAAGTGRGLRINGAGIMVLIENLAIRNGDATGLGGAQFNTDGGAGVLVEAADTATLNNVHLYEHIIDSRNVEEGRGAAVAGNNATLNIISSHIYSNSNFGTYVYGGGLFAANGALNITDSRIYGNEAWSESMDGPPGGYGGGVYADDSAPLSVVNSYIYDNYLNGQGGGLAVGAGSTLTVTGSAIYDNEAFQQGGGLYLPRTTAVISRSSIYGNRVQGNAFGVSYDRQGGGGLYLSSSSNVTIRQTLIASNTVMNRGLGGGIAVNCVRCTNNVVVENSTLSGNTAVEGGGGFSSYLEQSSFNATDSSITFDHVSIINNTATSGNGHAVNQERETGSLSDVSDVSASFTYRNSLIAGNGGTNECRNSATHDPASLEQTSGGYNLFIAGADCTDNGTGDQTAVDQTTLFTTVVANTVAANGTHPLVNNMTNPAFDAIAPGINGCTSGVSVDQRGTVRANGPNRGNAGCDVGAYELSFETPTAVSMVGLPHTDITTNSIYSGLIFAVLLILTGWAIGYTRTRDG